MLSPDSKILITEINQLIPRAVELSAHMAEIGKMRQMVETVEQELNETASRWHAISTGNIDGDLLQAAILMRMAFFENANLMHIAAQKLNTIAAKSKIISQEIGEIIGDDVRGLI